MGGAQKISLQLNIQRINKGDTNVGVCYSNMDTSISALFVLTIGCICLLLISIYIRHSCYLCYVLEGIDGLKVSSATCNFCLLWIFGVPAYEHKSHNWKNKCIISSPSCSCSHIILLDKKYRPTVGLWPYNTMAAKSLQFRETTLITRMYHVVGVKFC